MQGIYLLTIVAAFFASCTNSRQDMPEKGPIVGTWKLVTGMQIRGSDTVVTDYTQDLEMIKIYNDTHFAFLNHDLNQGKDISNAVFVAGGGRYDLKGDTYVEYLDYCNYREWENNKFELKYEIKGDTLITRGIERLDDLNIDQINIEKLVRIKDKAIMQSAL